MTREGRKRTPRGPTDFAAAMRLMRKHDPQLREDGFHSVLPHAHDYVGPLMDEFHAETDHGIQCWLLELIGEARSPHAYPLLLDCLHRDDESLRSWAIIGLKLLDTKEARRALWEVGACECE